ncbi:Hsp20/alpha crystallin family protein [Rickettsia bellii]|uniref:Hsp20/alpha crystallin family protein n=1 Tax=Rickettsia bellii TaxID=33990 RepID=UPI0012DDC853|nr:Hsp20 family protein [Rickettsia bellii]
MLYNNIKLYLITCITVIFLANTTIASGDQNTSNNNHYSIYLRHPLDFINRPFSSFDYYWNSIFDDRLSIYDSSSIKSKLITQDKQYILVLEVPGYDKKDIKIKTNNRKLFIEGKIKDTKADYVKKGPLCNDSFLCRGVTVFVFNYKYYNSYKRK